MPVRVRQIKGYSQENAFYEQDDAYLSLHLPGKQSPQIHALYFEQPVDLDKKMHRYLAEAKALANEPSAELTPHNPHLRNILNDFAVDLADSL